MSDNNVETYIMIEGNLMDAHLQPPQSSLQSAFRNSNGRIVIDMTAAKECARDLVRQSRSAEFAKNDAATLMALQNNDTTALNAAKVKGEKLRNAPTDVRIDNAATPDALLDVVDVICEEMKV